MSKYPDIDAAADRLLAALLENKKRKQTYHIWSRMARLGRGGRNLAVMFTRGQTAESPVGDDQDAGPGSA